MTFLRARGAWLCCPPILLCALDTALTLFGQSSGYWNGDYRGVNELSPTFNQLLHVHPCAFVVGALGWVAVFSIMILLLPELWAMAGSVAVTIGHMAGAASWIVWRPYCGYALSNALFAVTSILVVFTFKLGQSPTGGAAIDWRKTGLPGWTRWVLLAVLAMVPIYLYLIPRQP